MRSGAPGVRADGHEGCQAGPAGACLIALTTNLGETVGQIEAWRETRVLFLLELGPNQLGTVAAGENDFEVGLIDNEFVGEIAAADGFRHDHVGEQKIDLVVET